MRDTDERTETEKRNRKEGAKGEKKIRGRNETKKEEHAKDKTRTKMN